MFAEDAGAPTFDGNTCRIVSTLLVNYTHTGSLCAMADNEPESWSSLGPAAALDHDDDQNKEARQSSKRKRQRLNDRQKGQAVYESLDIFKQIQTLVDRTLAAQEALREKEDGVDAEKLAALSCQSLTLISNAMRREIKNIASVSSNTTVRKHTGLVHAKTNRVDRLKRKNDILVRSGGMPGNDVVSNLESTLDSVSRSLETLVSTSIRGPAWAAATAASAQKKQKTSVAPPLQAAQSSSPAVPPGTQAKSSSSSANVVVYQKFFAPTVPPEAQAMKSSSSTNVVVYQNRDWTGLVCAGNSSTSSTHGAGKRRSKSSKGAKENCAEKTNDESFWYADGDTGAIVVNDRTLPLPADGTKSYSPLEMCRVLQAEEKYGEQSLKSGEARTHLRQVKDAMRLAKFIGIKSHTQVNEIYKRFKKTGEANQYWGEMGPREIMPMDDLVSFFLAKHDGETWTEDETKACLVERKRAQFVSKGLDPNSAKDPDCKTVKIYHTALMDHKLVAGRIQGNEGDPIIPQIEL